MKLLCQSGGPCDSWNVILGLSSLYLNHSPITYKLCDLKHILYLSKFQCPLHKWESWRQEAEPLCEGCRWADIQGMEQVP